MSIELPISVFVEGAGVSTELAEYRFNTADWSHFPGIAEEETEDYL